MEYKDKDRKYKKSKPLSKWFEAFSLAEAMIALLIAAIVLAATMPVITRKHLMLPQRGPHGKWACTLINNEEHSAMAAEQNAPMPALDSGKWKKGCAFPTLPSNVPYVMIQVVGGGAGGNTQGGLPSLDFMEIEDDFIIPDIEDGAFEIPADGEYEMTIAGRKGEKGLLKPSNIRIKQGSIVIIECAYPGAAAATNNMSIRFKRQYKSGDKLWINPVVDDTQETEMKICDASKYPAIKIVLPDGSVKTANVTILSNFQLVPGKNGDTVQLYEKIYKTKQTTKIAEIEGTSGGMYRNNISDESCGYLNCQRYESVMRKYRNAEDLVKLYPTDKDSDVQQIPGGEGAKIHSTGVTVAIRGACGGAAGSVNTILFPRQDNYDNTVHIGRGGASGQNGESTVFNHVTAKGGRGCSSVTEIGFGDKLGYGGDGSTASTSAQTDSKGGVGGKGGFGMLKAEDGKPGQGFGAGGGGGGVAINMTKEEVENAKYSNREQIRAKMTEGLGGAGAPGSIIVSW